MSSPSTPAKDASAPSPAHSTPVEPNRRDDESDGGEGRREDPGARYLASLDDAALEALLEALLLVASADGSLGDAERSRLVECVTALDPGRLTAAEAGRRLERIGSRAAADGRAARLATLSARLPDARARQVALVLAADIAAADGLLHEAEHHACLELAAALGLDAPSLAALGIGVAPTGAR